MKNCNSLKTGGDPRPLPDYAALRDELAKLSHPARPDVDWLRVEQLSLSLFRQNGVELQTVSWYTLARTRLAGIAGLNEGLAMLDALLTYQWGALWPQPVHARMDILAGFSQRLQSMLRTLTLQHADLQQVYLAEQHLDTLRDALQRLELKNVSQIGELCTFMHNAAARLESSDEGHRDIAAVVAPVSSVGLTAHSEPLIYVVREEPPEPRIVCVPPEPVTRRPWRVFAAGMLTMLVAGVAGLWGWQKSHPVPLSPLPVVANEVSLTTLGQLPPLWRQQYGFALAARGEPAEAEVLKAQWQQSISGNALPTETLSGWHQGMEGLADLTRRLNALDERKGRYLTGSELKSMVFTITQNFSRAVPAEEQLYQLYQFSHDKPLPAARLLQTDMHFNQLLNRYALIIQQAETL